MSQDFAAAFAAAIDRRAAEDTTSLDEARRARTARKPDQNTPFQSEVYRAPRQRTYRDPTGEEAIGNMKKENR